MLRYLSCHLRRRIYAAVVSDVTLPRFLMSYEEEDTAVVSDVTLSLSCHMRRRIHAMRRRIHACILLLI
jgi:hypothetical protein